MTLETEPTAPDSPVEKQSLWQTVKSALLGTHLNYTEGPLGPAILALAIPMVLEMIMESIFAVVDVFYVGKLGSDAIATVGLTESLLTVIYTIAMGLSIGVTALVARRTGEKDTQRAAETAGQALLLGAAVSIIISIFGVTFAADLLALMGASPEVLSQGTSYAQIMLGGNISILLLFLSNAICRGSGDGAIAMRSLWLANSINIALAPCLIFGFGPFPKLGLPGAAVATTIGRGIGAAFTISYLFRGKSRIKLSLEFLKPSPVVLMRLLNISSSGMLQIFIGTASWIGMARVVSLFGSKATAGYTIGVRIILFALLPSFGMSNAAATMVGQALGAKNPARAESAVWMTGFYNMCFLGTTGLIFVLFPQALVANFSNDPEVVSVAVSCLRTVAFGFLFYAYGMVISMSFNGAGDTKTPTFLNLVSFWLIEIPMAYLLSVPMGMGPFGAFLAITISFSLFAVFSAIIFRQGRWKKQMV
jgi:putative MATE family efflux protein